MQFAKIQRDPYLLFFPLGILLAWAGVSHWLFYASGLLGDFRPVFHAMTQIHSFIMTFICGFLFTMLPRRTNSPPPSPIELILAVTMPIATALASWTHHPLLGQAFWGVFSLVLLIFTLRRFRSPFAKRNPPVAFIWIPLAFITGWVGSLSGIFYYSGFLQSAALHTLSKVMALQGTVLPVIIGVGAMVFPLMLYGRMVPAKSAIFNDHSGLVKQLSGYSILFASFLIEAYANVRLGYLLRFSFIAGYYLFVIKAHRLPTLPGLNRKLIWTAAWLIPLGYLVSGLFPSVSRGALHISFIGGFALLCISVSLHVVMGHGGFGQLQKASPPLIRAVGVTLFLALVNRLLMELDPAHYFFWMGWAASLFLISTLAWCIFALPKLWKITASR